ncbi:MAG: restriction endonuclease subunit S [Planctomycetes bacterium]|nr:restriction endonuclease subunit S [Planctomycetota bacterium]
MELRTYPKYKSSGIEWLGEVPEGWEIKPLKRTFFTLNGSTPKSAEPAYWDGDIPWATPDDLGSLQGDTLHATRRMITREGFESCGTSLAPAGSIILSTRAPIGHLALAGVNLCTNQGCRCLVFREKVEKRFYYYQLLTAKLELESWGQGSTFKELSRDKLTAVYLASPSLDEQRAIAAFLDQETARIDALIGRKERQIELLQEKRTALISHAVTRGLNPDVKMKPSGLEWLGEIPEGWEVKKTKYCCRLNMGQSPTSEECNADGDGMPFLQGCAEFGTVSPTPRQYCDTARKVAAKGDILISVRAPVGAIGRGLCSVRPRQDSIDVIFCWYLIHEMRSQLSFHATGSTYEAVAAEDVGNIRFVLPPLDVQRAIAAYLDRETAHIDAVIGKVNDSIDKLSEYRSALISAAVTGKIDVRGVA